MSAELTDKAVSDADLGESAAVETAVCAGVSARRCVDVEMLCHRRPLDMSLLVDKLVTNS